MREMRVAHRLNVCAPRGALSGLSLILASLRPRLRRALPLRRRAGLGGWLLRLHAFAGLAVSLLSLRALFRLAAGTLLSLRALLVFRAIGRVGLRLVVSPLCALGLFALSSRSRAFALRGGLGRLCGFAGFLAFARLGRRGLRLVLSRTAPALFLHLTLPLRPMLAVLHALAGGGLLVLLLLLGKGEASRRSQRSCGGGAK